MPSKELMAASSTPIVLGILSRGESYGYEIIRRVREVSEGHIEWTDGMLYPVLHRLERRGLIQSRWGSAENGRRRKYYKLKRNGKAALASERSAWLAVHTTLNRLWSSCHA